LYLSALSPIPCRHQFRVTDAGGRVGL
jgi:hypothetical protein